MRLLQLLVIAQPVANLGNPLTMQAQLTGAATWVAYGQNEKLVAFESGVRSGFGISPKSAA